MLDIFIHLVHPSDSSPAICQGGSGAVNIFGGNNTFESLIINGKKTVSTPNLSSGKLPAKCY